MSVGFAAAFGKYFASLRLDPSIKSWTMVWMAAGFDSIVITVTIEAEEAIDLWLVQIVGAVSFEASLVVASLVVKMRSY